MMRLKPNDVNFEVKCEGPSNYSKAYFMNIFRCFDDHMQPQNLPHCQNVIMSTSFFMNLLHNQAVQISDLGYWVYQMTSYDVI